MLSIRSCAAAFPCTPLSVLFPDYGANISVDPLLTSSPEVLLAPPTLCRASIRTLNEPLWARCMLGSDLKPRPITTVTDLGCLGAAI